ncbi:MAG: ribonuclease HII [Bacteroidota bacterium]
MNSNPMLHYEQTHHRRGIRLVAGIDEAGRGPLAGPVVAAAVMFEEGKFVDGVDDSKRLPPARREELFDEIMVNAAAAGIGIVESDQIDRLNILNATFLAMDRAVGALALRPTYLIIDGNRFRPGEATKGIPFVTVVGGDGLCFSVAAASIVAKVTRDRIMTKYDTEFPGFGFARHKGYGTVEHREAIARLGVCPIHRRTFTMKSGVRGGNACCVPLMEDGGLRTEDGRSERNRTSLRARPD